MSPNSEATDPMSPDLWSQHYGLIERIQEAVRQVLMGKEEVVAAVMTAILAVLVMLVLLYVEFGNAKIAGIVLLNLPLALIGGVVTVYCTTGIVSIASTIGFISLFGIATRNGILLISRHEDLKREGVGAEERLSRAALDRLNPILMTACTTGLALIPLVLKGGEAGNEIQSPMALVILGGLLTSTLLNLVVIPCLLKVQTDTTPARKSH